MDRLQVQDISGLIPTKLIVLAESSKFFWLDLKKINLKKIAYVDTKPIDLILIVHQAATLDLKIVGVGELFVDLNLRIELMGIDSQVEVTGAFFMTKKSCVKLNVAQNHLTPNAQSVVTIKTVLSEAAQFAYRGNILIAEHASGTIADQQNQNMLLSAQAGVQSIPSIEVLNSDVQCGHGSAVGGLDHEQLVYLMSRGLTKSAATMLLLKSFLGFDLDLEDGSDGFNDFR